MNEKVKEYVNQFKVAAKEKRDAARRNMTDDQFKKCKVAIHTATAASSAFGLIPVPFADAIPISAAQITMVISLGKIFGKKLTESAAKGIIGAAAGTFIGRSAVKIIPFLGPVVSAIVAGVITEGIGWMAALDFSKQAESVSYNKYLEERYDEDEDEAEEEEEDKEEN